jgi:DNA polymerase-4
MNETLTPAPFNRAVLHLDLDAFFASVEVLRNRALNGRPVVVGGTRDRGVVASCNFEARHFGIRKGMPMKHALFLCPTAVVLRGDTEVYARYSALVRDIIAEQAPLFEQAALDEFYLDLTGMDKFFGCWKWSNELRARVLSESGLPVSLGLAINKTVARVSAVLSKPNGTRLVPAGTEKGFLAPLPVSRIPAIELDTARQLARMGVRTCRVLSEIPPQLLEYEFGADGRQLWKKANGQDDAPVVPYEEQEALSTEYTFPSDTTDLRVLHDELRRQTARLAFELRTAGKLTSSLTLKLRYTDGNTYTRHARITHTAHDRVLIEKVLILFEKLFERRQLIRMVGLRLGGLVSGGYQFNLFEDTESEAQLLQAMDKVRRRFGNDAISRG